MLFNDNLDCILECKKCVTSSSRVRVGAQLLEVELQCSLGEEAVGGLHDLLKVLLVAVTGGSLLLLAFSTLCLLLLLLLNLLLLAFSFRLACLPC